MLCAPGYHIYYFCCKQFFFKPILKIFFLSRWFIGNNISTLHKVGVMTRKAILCFRIQFDVPRPSKPHSIPPRFVCTVRACILEAFMWKTEEIIIFGLKSWFCWLRSTFWVNGPGPVFWRSRWVRSKIWDLGVRPESNFEVPSTRNEFLMKIVKMKL